MTKIEGDFEDENKRILEDENSQKGNRIKQKGERAQWIPARARTIS
jgi:hypothetical protein